MDMGRCAGVDLREGVAGTVIVLLASTTFSLISSRSLLFHVHVHRLTSTGLHRTIPSALRATACTDNLHRHTAAQDSVVQVWPPHANF